MVNVHFGVRCFMLGVTSKRIAHYVCSSRKYRKCKRDYYADISLPLRRQQLHDLVSKQRYISYRGIWQFLESAHQSKSDENLITLYYSRRNISKLNKASGDQQANNEFWNREHVWPQSNGLKGNSARRDLHNIVPADRSVNSSRGNKYFDDGGTSHNECKACSTDTDSWEPPDEVKGDIARILLYMDLRYDGNDSSGAADLILGEDRSSDRRYFRGLLTAQQWHCNDPVSDRERAINEAVYSYQSNRNPFVDYPHWAESVFSFNCE